MQRHRPRFFLRFFASILLPVAAIGAVPSLGAAADVPPLRADRPPFFSADVSISVDAEGRSQAAVSISLAYTELQWVKLTGGYGAGAEFAVVFQPRKSTRMYGDAWVRRVAVPSFETTRSPNAVVLERRTFALPPGPYDLRITVEDLDAHEESYASQRINVPDHSRVPVGFADLELGIADSVGTFTPVPTRRLGMNVVWLAARAVLFDRRPGDWPRHYSFRHRIRDEHGDELLTGTQDVTLQRSAEPVVIRPGRPELFLGTYVFEVELLEGQSKWRVERSFEVEESGPPRGKEYERMLEPLAYIAEVMELEELRAASTPEQQTRAWDEFWKRRDPSPETQRNEAMLEFFRRVRYAEEHFQGYGPGWRSDMGRIYIRYGPPDQVESRPATAQSPPLEIWYYNRPYRRLVFEDREGFGRYVLRTGVGE
ncbi:MAG TPA: GWxTD domain-containing protein [Gemmatimonadales bacterium]|nr:GWxTD domain-containing protein [Gemmatimonadales bacterium]